MSKSAIRRHHEKRIKDKVSKYHLFQGWNSWSDLGEDAAAKALGKMARTKAVCSCWMCGNPRKWDKEVTIQEQSHKELARLDLSNL